jgi:hypothetical protein
MIKMKTKLIGICILLIGSHTISAQSKQPRAIIGLGFGVGNVHELKYEPSSSGLIDWSQYPLNDAFHLFNHNWNISRTPVFVVNADLRIDERFGLGAGISYDQGRLNYKHEETSYSYVDFFGIPLFMPTTETILHYSLRYSRLNFGARGLYYFRTDPVADIYTGIRLGVTQYAYQRELYVIKTVGNTGFPNPVVRNVYSFNSSFWVGTSI